MNLSDVLNLVLTHSKIKSRQIYGWGQMTGWSRKSKAQPCTLADLHHTSWQKTGTMINSAAPENEDRCLGRWMSAHFTGSEIRFFWSCLQLPLVHSVLIALVFRTDMKKGRNIKSLQRQLPRLMWTPSSGLSADKINWSWLFPFFHLYLWLWSQKTWFWAII